jgi:hypothetical protein
MKFSYGSDATTGRKSPPKRSLDGALENSFDAEAGLQPALTVASVLLSQTPELVGLFGMKDPGEFACRAESRSPKDR